MILSLLCSSAGVAADNTCMAQKILRRTEPYSAAENQRGTPAFSSIHIFLFCRLSRNKKRQNEKLLGQFLLFLAIPIRSVGVLVCRLSGPGMDPIAGWLADWWGVLLYPCVCVKELSVQRTVWLSVQRTVCLSICPSVFKTVTLMYCK